MDNNSKPIADAAQREKALDPTRSFIVQAPAGSGKTELLIQRYLKLLAMVLAPEEIIAITFTRKAAAEMRNRILEALERGKDDTPPGEFHARTTWNLAKNALSQNKRHQWQVLENPSRLKIQTIDSLCARLTRQMPFLSKFGAQPQITEQPEVLYKEAARNTVADLETGSKWSPSIESLVRHLDNHLVKIENLVAGMLAKRDQWLRHTIQSADERLVRKALEQALNDLICDALENARDRFPKPGLDILLASARFSAKNLKKANPSSLICACDGLTDLPGTSAADTKKWLGFAELLLTGKGEWRKAANKNIGFPAPSSAKNNSALKQELAEAKDIFLDYLHGLEGEDAAADALHRVRILPDPSYTDEQWHIMQALFEILTVAVGHLELVFKAAGQVDFAELGLRASKALGEPENPTDLSLSLDYRISHILMDEFQDTSFTHYELIERLTAGWVTDDGRSFFAVGDPMQSIYAFREAEVGLFLNAWENGLSQVALQPLTLTVNFRSQQGIIDWVNEHFPKIMPKTVDITTGRVPYSPSRPFHPLLTGRAVNVHTLIPANPEEEAIAVRQCVVKAKKADPAGTIAILVRSRSHLKSIVPVLKNAGILFQAVEIDSLKDRPVITDLTSLTRALSHPADRIAWLAVLRAPWCGMTLEDMFLLVDGNPGKTIPALIKGPDRVDRLSPDGQKRFRHIQDILLPAMEHRNRKSLRRLVEGVWISLGGPACVYEASELEDVSVFFDLLDQHTGNNELTDVASLEDAAALLYARPDVFADDTIQIMTIHKAKGLEFDTVILPGLEKRPPAAQSQLLLWLERATGYKKDLLLAPISETGTDRNKIYNFIQKVLDEKRANEDARLLYVAATRAKKRLHLLGGVVVTPEAEEIRQPSQKSLLGSLWPAVSERFYQMKHVAKRGKDKLLSSDDLRPSEPVVVPYIRRFSDGWKLPTAPPDIEWKPRAVSKSDARDISKAPEFDWAGETARHVGIVVHAWLRVIGEQGIVEWNARKVDDLTLLFEKNLKQSGVSDHQLSDAVESVKTALKNILGDDRGRWILGGHKNSACEYALTGRIDNEIVSVKLDRTFIDNDGVRWIIDYKTGSHKGGSAKDFLDREKLRYQDQLNTYAKLMQAKEDREVRLGLYFPQLKGWREL